MSDAGTRFLEDASGYRGHADRILAPASIEQLAAEIARAHAAAIPVTIAGAGTGVTGGRVPHGGWVLSTEKLNRLRIFPGHADAGAGVVLRDLHHAAECSGQLYPPDPTEWTASVGGTVATNASGSRSFRYGSTRRWTRQLTVVLADGSVRVFRRGEAIDFPVPDLPLPATTKNTAGYPLRAGMDWVDLFIGSEGTLGVVVEAELALLPAPGALLTGVVFFPDDEKAVAAVDTWRGVANLRMLEYLDYPSLQLLGSRFPGIPPAARAAILIEEEGAEADPWLDRLEQSGALTEASWFAAAEADRERFRRFRHALPELVNDTVRRNGFMKLGSDYAVPPDRNLDMLSRYRALLDDAFPGRYVIFGHIGDAHLHVNILPASQQEFDRGRDLMNRLAAEAVALGGTVSAEHGLGKRKAHLLGLQYSGPQLQAMQAVKRRLDPNWILGRGSLFPAPEV